MAANETGADPEALPCADKLAFDTKREADGAAVFVHHRHGTVVRAYKCLHCNLWHLSSASD